HKVVEDHRHMSAVESADSEVDDAGTNGRPIIGGDGDSVVGHLGEVMGVEGQRGGRCGHLTAPMDRPWTSLSWAAIPATSTGTEMMSEAAHTCDRNRPWEVTKLVRNTGAVDAAVEVSTVAKRSSFHEKMKQISAVAASPGAVSGSRICMNTRGSRAPSSSAASRTSTGTSARKERIIHTAIGMFIAE